MSYFSSGLASQTVAIEGAEIAFRRFGENRGGVPLVLCQRFRGTMDDWDPALLDALAVEREVIIFDSAGVGESTGQAPASTTAMAQVASQFIRTQASQVDVLGWSMGGMVALHLALVDPELVRRVVVAASTPGAVEGARAAPAKVWEVAGKPVNDDEDFLYLFFPHSEEGRAAGQAYLERLAQRDSRSRVKTESVMAQLQALNRINAEDTLFPHLSDIRQPVLMANGVEDIMVHAYASYAAVEALPQGKCTVYPSAGHGFLFQHNEAFSREVNAFLNDAL